MKHEPIYPPLVLLPGRMSDATCWTYQIAHFQRSREIIIPTGFETRDSIRGMAEAIAPQLPQRFDLVGWSMGGFIAFELMAMLGERVNKLVLISTSAQPESEAARSARRRVLEDIDRLGFEAVIRTMRLASSRPGAVDPALASDMLLRSIAMGEAAMRSQSMAIMNREDHRDGLSGLAVPTLVIVGDQDVVTPPPLAREIADGVPRGRLELIAGAGHSSPIEQPVEVNRLIEGFLGH